MMRRQKGQAPVMEYIAFLFMAVLVIITLLFLVFGFQFMTMGSDAASGTEKRSLFLLQSMISSDVTRATSYQSMSVLEDAKLTALARVDCTEFQSVFGDGIWINITIYMEKPDCEGLGSDYYDCMTLRDEISVMQATPCDDTNYPNCGTWTFCDENKAGRMVYRSVPVNIYRKMEKRLSLGVLTVGVPAEVG
jgi:hypothetical protein